MKRVLSISIFLLAVWGMTAQPNRYLVRTLTANEGLSHADANFVVQDKKGYMWIATYSGLNRYDGYDIKVYLDKNHGSDNVYYNRISYLGVDESVIWAATRLGLTYFDSRLEKFFNAKAKTAALQDLLQKQVGFLFISSHKYLIISGLGWSHLCRIGKDRVLEEVENPMWQKGTNINAALEDAKGNIWFVSSKGLFCLSPDGLSIKPVAQEILKGQPLRNICKNQENELLISSDNCFYRIKMTDFYEKGQTENLPYVKIAVNVSIFKAAKGASDNLMLNNIIADSFGNIWLGTQRGLVQMRYDNNPIPSFKTYETDLENYHSNLSSTALRHLFIDKTGSLWVSTIGGGVNILNLRQKKFQTIRRDIHAVGNTLPSNYISALLENQDGSGLWVGTRESGLSYYDLKNRTFKNYFSNIIDPLSISDNRIKSLAFDHQNRLWVGTENGLNRFENGHFMPFFQRKTRVDSEIPISALGTDRLGQLWVGTWSKGLKRLRFNADGTNNIVSFTPLSNSNIFGISSDRITFICPDSSRNEVIVGTDKGIDHFFLTDKGDVAQIRHYKGSEKGQLGSNYIWPIVRVSARELWIGTIGGGLNHVFLNDDGTYQATVLSDNQVLPANDIESLLPDQQGNFWLGSSSGLAKFNPKNNRFTRFDVNDGLQGNSFKVNSACSGRNGRLYFGGVNGFSYFNPNDIESETQEAQAVITDVLVNNHPLRTGDISGLNEAISYTSALVLKYSENNFVLRFSALQFTNPAKCQYRYRLEGFQKDWVYTDARNRQAAYSNLDYGTYTFLVEATNPDGVWSNKPTRLTVQVSPPWWLSNLAKFIYFSLVIGILYGIFYYQQRLFKLQKTVVLQKMEEEKQEAIHNLRIQFFTNISHDLRTPLTLILAPVERLLKNIKDPSVSTALQGVSRNAQKLLALINELMDFRRAESGALTLHIQAFPINQVVREATSAFSEAAAERGILLTQHEKISTNLVFLDKGILEKILANLIGNAVKYTSEGGQIDVTVFDKLDVWTSKFPTKHEILHPKRANKTVSIQIVDTGMGIPADELHHIFEEYFRVSNTSKTIGSGIGLATVKSLVALHKGDIRMSSTSGKGTEFVVTLPCTADFYTATEQQKQTTASLESTISPEILLSSTPNNAQTLPSVFATPIIEKNNTKKQKLLIVEDNDELRALLVEEFSAFFRVVEAVDGQEGLEKIHAELPDLVVSDVMMPRMDGFQLCQAIRNDISICHTPIVLLTAKESTEARLSGADAGADVYFSKPFNRDLLQKTVQNLLQSRQIIRDRYAKDYYADAQSLVQNQKDKQFLDAFIAVIEEKMGEEDLDVGVLCKELGMSRTVLYEKVKALTGKSINDFSRSLRLKKAARLLTEKDISVADAMMQVGFSSASYFTKAFKNEFGKTPTDFLAHARHK